jgi:hypothetical protein
MGGVLDLVRRSGRSGLLAFCDVLFDAHLLHRSTLTSWGQTFIDGVESPGVGRSKLAVDIEDEHVVEADHQLRASKKEGHEIWQCATKSMRISI